MIPKIIHYCWFGRGEKPELAIKCIESWKKYLPDYEIIEWNENNFDLDLYPFTREAYDNRKYAFVTDVVRLYVLKNYGGVYFDTDVEVLSSLDGFMNHIAFSGFDNDDSIPTGIMASTKNGRWISLLLNYYEDRHFVKADGTFETITNCKIISSITDKFGLARNNTYQEIPNLVTLYPKDYFCPKSYFDGKIYKTNNTVCIHHFSGSWLPKEQRIEMAIWRKLGITHHPSFTWHIDKWLDKLFNIKR